MLPVMMRLWCGGVSCERVMVRGEGRKWEWRKESQRGRNLHASVFERNQVQVAECDSLSGFVVEAVHCVHRQYSLWTAGKKHYFNAVINVQ